MTVARIATWLIATIIGAVFGAAGTVSTAVLLVAPVIGPVPVGMLLGVVGAAGLLVGLRLLSDDRWVVVAAAVGTVGAAVVFSGTGPGGSTVAPGGAITVAWLIVLAVLAAGVAAWPVYRNRDEPPGGRYPGASELGSNP